MRELKQIMIMEDVCQYIGVRLEEISCYLSEKNQLLIRGSINAQSGYSSKGDLRIRADVLNEDGKVIYNMEDYQRRDIAFLHDSFEISSFDTFDILKQFDLDKCMIRVYPVIRTSNRRGLDE